MPTYTPINDTTVKKATANGQLALTLSTGTTAYPVIYSDNMWQIADTGTPLATALGATGSYTQETINNWLLNHVNGGGIVSIEVVEDHTQVAEPSATTIYFEPNDDALDIWNYVDDTWVPGGSLSLGLEDYAQKDGLTANKIAYAKDSNTVGTVNVSKGELEDLMDSYKGESAGASASEPVAGSLGKLLNDWRNNDLGTNYVLPVAEQQALGGIKTGFTEDAANKNYPVVVDGDGNAYVNVPWQGNETEADATHDGIMTKEVFKQVAVYKDVIPTNTESAFKEAVVAAFNSNSLKAFFAPMSIGTTNCLDIDTNGATVHVFARFARTDAASGTAGSSSKWECRFEIGADGGNYNCHLNFNGSSLTLLYEEYATAASSVATLDL